MNNSTNSTIVFSMGLPAAGKSTWISANLSETHTIIDPDAVKETHPDYDPKNPQALHAWSKEITDRMFLDALTAGSGLFVVDGTGTNSEKMIRRMKQARAAGFAVELVYVACSLETSLKRNAARARVVPPAILIEKAADISTSFEVVSPYADNVRVIEND